MFYLGVHVLSFLTKTDVPLFVSRNAFRGRRKMPVARGRWALDSGAFTEIQKYGTWSIGPVEYVEQVRRIRDGVGNMDWAAIQDWMCEPPMLEKTGLTIPEHQSRTIQNYFDLMDLAPEIPWVPVLQGWEQHDYVSHFEQYLARGVDLRKLDTVGLGSVCRRQATKQFVAIVTELHGLGLKLHGFGVKSQGLRKCAEMLQSSDSLAWSFAARRLQRIALLECVGGPHKNCANCLPYALQWRRKLLRTLPESWNYNDSGNRGDS